MHHRRGGEEMPDQGAPLGEIVRLLEGDGMVFQRLPPHHQDEAVGHLDALAQFQAVKALGGLDEFTRLGEGGAEQIGLTGTDGKIAVSKIISCSCPI